jgi:catechol 2,3-dioxygenase-like lactoylglutathione lyase family enzyme
MLKIVVFGFYGPDHTRMVLPDRDDHLSPVNTGDFMRTVWQMEPPQTRIGGSPDAPCFAKLTGIASQPVYVQSLSNRMAPGAGLLNCDGYVAIIDAVKILAPRTIQSALHRLAEQHPRAHLIIAAGRQGEPDALSSEEIRAVLGLHPDLPVYPYVPGEPKTVHRLIRRLARYISDPNRVPPPIFAGEQPTLPQENPAAMAPAAAGSRAAPQVPRIHGLAHVAITVSDLSRALDFYRGLLGFHLLGHLDWPDDPDGLTITLLDTGRGTLELFSYANVPVKPALPADDMRAGLQHLALDVTDLDAIAEQLACAGVPFTIEPKNIPGGVRIAFFTDPDGTSIELIEGDLAFTRR